jgi:undecaprenyl-diphosphatase
MMTALSAGILGIIEGITEFLPVSSTAHLILAADIMQIGEAASTKTFEIAIQGGAILAVVVFFWRSFFDIELLKKIIFAFIPTGIIGLLLYKIVKTYLLGNIFVVLAALAIGGALLILFEWNLSRNNNAGHGTISYYEAFIIGLCQACAIIPGVSRSAATIVGGLYLGISREIIVEFSFLLAVPTLLAATGLDVIKNINTFSAADGYMLAIGSTTAFITALLSIKYFLVYIRRHSLVAFGVYRIVLAGVFLLLVF